MDENLRTAFVNLSNELKRVRRNNLRLRLHMEVLVTTPKCKTAQVIRDTYQLADMSESVIHLN